MRTMSIIEDERLLGSELKRRFERGGWQVTVSETIADARHLIVELGMSPTIVLSDMNLPDGNGLDFLEEVRAAGGHGEWIFLSGYGTRRDIERAAELGALDFLAKPLDTHKLDLTIAAATRGARARQRIVWGGDRNGTGKSGPKSPKSRVTKGQRPKAQKCGELRESAHRAPTIARALASDARYSIGPPAQTTAPRISRPSPAKSSGLRS